MSDDVIVPETLPAIKNPDISAIISATLGGRAAGTIRNYQADLDSFAARCAMPLNEAIAQFLRQGAGAANRFLFEYRNELKSTGFSSSYINRKITVLRHITKVARMYGIITWEAEVPALPVDQQGDMSGPGQDGFLKILAFAQQEPDAPTRERNVCLLWLLFGRALRRNEAVSLDMEHVNIGRRTISILGKGRQSRETLTLAAQTLDALCAWYNRRKSMQAKGSDPLFVALDRHHYGTRLSGTSVYRMVRGYGAEVGIEGIVRPHGLRHSAVTAALTVMNGDVRKVQRFSRHRDVRMIQKYDDDRTDFGGEVADKLGKNIP